jgi:hypothetical protein
MSDSTTLAAVKSCGCIGALIVETGTDTKSLTTFYRDAGRDGYEVRRFTTDEVRVMPWRCAAHPRQVQAQLFGRPSGGAA